ncbi:hypothetical protein V8E53_007161 [Lactarius tabidus]
MPFKDSGSDTPGNRNRSWANTATQWRTGSGRHDHPWQGVVHQQVPPTHPVGPSNAGGFITPTFYPPGCINPPPGNSSYPGEFAPQGPPPNFPRNRQQDECYAWFVAMDQDGSGEMSPEELHSALINDGGLRLSISTVKYLMSIFDFDNSRVIGFQEFEALWNYINQWRQMFESFDIDRNGKIDADELGRALAHYGLHVGPPVLDLLVKKYASTPPHYGGPPPRPQIDLDRFVYACAVVRQMCHLYGQCSGLGAAQMNRDDFIRAEISLL